MSTQDGDLRDALRAIRALEALVEGVAIVGTIVQAGVDVPDDELRMIVFASDIRDAAQVGQAAMRRHAGRQSPITNMVRLHFARVELAAEDHIRAWPQLDGRPMPDAETHRLIEEVRRLTSLRVAFALELEAAGPQRTKRPRGRGALN
jgi:hypothetical protein